jgi:hypothetical protein
MNSGKRKGAGAGNRRQHIGSAALVRRGRFNTTLGDLIAAAFDTVGSEVRAVADLVSSSDMARVIGRRIVLT